MCSSRYGVISMQDLTPPSHSTVTKEQRKLLRRRLRVAIDQQPEIKMLRAMLLGIGGVELVAPSGFDSDVPRLIGSGLEMAGLDEGPTLVFSRWGRHR